MFGMLYCMTAYEVRNADFIAVVSNRDHFAIQDPIKYPFFDVSNMSYIRSHTYKIPNIIPTLTGYELCKGGGINGGWKVVQRNPSCPKMDLLFKDFLGGA